MWCILHARAKHAPLAFSIASRAFCNSTWMTSVTISAWNNMQVVNPCWITVPLCEYVRKFKWLHFPVCLNHPLEFLSSFLSTNNTRCQCVWENGPTWWIYKKNYVSSKHGMLPIPKPPNHLFAILFHPKIKHIWTQQEKTHVKTERKMKTTLSAFWILPVWGLGLSSEQLRYQILWHNVHGGRFLEC